MYPGWGMAGGILGCEEAPGMHPGQEHLGGPKLPMREIHSQLVLLLGRPVDSRLGLSSPNRCVPLTAHLCLPAPVPQVQVQHGAGKNPRPNHNNQGECSMEEGEKASSCRNIALDIHKYYSVIGGVNKEGEEVMEICRVEHTDLEDWLERHLMPSDRVVIESTTNAWHVYDLLEPLVAEVLVAYCFYRYSGYVII